MEGRRQLPLRRPGAARFPLRHPPDDPQVDQPVGGRQRLELDVVRVGSQEDVRAGQPAGRRRRPGLAVARQLRLPERPALRGAGARRSPQLRELLQRPGRPAAERRLPGAVGGEGLPGRLQEPVRVGVLPAVRGQHTAALRQYAGELRFRRLEERPHLRAAGLRHGSEEHRTPQRGHAGGLRHAALRLRGLEGAGRRQPGAARGALEGRRTRLRDLQGRVQRPDAAGPAAFRGLRAPDREGPLLCEGPAVAEPEGRPDEDAAGSPGARAVDLPSGLRRPA